MNLQEVERITVGIARGAGRLLMPGLTGEKSITTKGSEFDLLTEYDRAADAFITGELRKHFPGHKVMSEEQSNPSNRPEDLVEGYTWHIDPLDGTINFVHGYPVFSVSIALYKENRPLVGVVYDPARDECFSAAANQGAKLSHGDHSTPIRVSQAANLVKCLLATGFAADTRDRKTANIALTAAFLERIRGIRRSGSAALDLSYVAAGRLDGYWEMRLHRWDVAAGVLIVTEAGGSVTHLDGQPFRLQTQLSVLASNGQIHSDMLAIITGADYPRLN